MPRSWGIHLPSVQLKSLGYQGLVVVWTMGVVNPCRGLPICLGDLGQIGSFTQLLLPAGCGPKP